MPKVRRVTHHLKAKVAVEAIQAHKTAPRLAEVWPSDPGRGLEKQALAGLPTSLVRARACASSRT